MIRRLLLAAAIILCAGGARAAETIHNYDTAIAVRPDGTLHITETIDVTAEGTQIRRGIYRVLPQGRRMPLGGILPTDYDIVSVTRNGANEPHFIEQGGGALTLYIGDSDTLIPHGRHVYRIVYTVAAQVSHFSAFDELNWNTVGTEWSFPIESATATITLPDGAPVLNHAVYTGNVFSTDGDYESTATPGKLTVRTGRLEPGEGVTVALSWPKGYMTDTLSGPAFFLKQHPGLLLVLGALAATIFYYLGAWRKYGRDPRPRRRAPFYSAPAGISPGMAAHIQKMGDARDDRALTAAVISLCAQGLLEIEESAAGDFLLRPTGGKSDNIAHDEFIVLSGIGDSLTLTPSNARWIAIAREHARAVDAACGKAFYEVNTAFWLMGWLPLAAATILLAWQGHISPFVFIPFVIAIFIGDSVRAVIMDNKNGHPRLRAAATVALTLPPTALALLMAGGTLMGGPAVSWLTILAMAVCVLVIFMTRHALKRPTLRGLEIMEQIDGLQLYMEAVEEKILKTFDPPQMSRQLYEDYLPYAVALNVESKWGDKFAASVAGASVEEALVRTGGNPRWYKTGGGNAVTGPFSIGGMIGYVSHAVSAASSSPSGSSSGGGSVGSGGGGGGGGGW